MDLRRIGAVFRAIRIKKRWRQVDLSARAGVSRGAVSRLERGRAAEISLAELTRIADALDVTLRLTAGWQGGHLDRLLNARHSALHEAVARELASRSGWLIAPEVSFSYFGERGVIDILAWHAQTQTLLVIELKTEIVDISDLMGSVDRKRRLAPKIAAEREWVPARVCTWVIVGDSSTNRRRVAKHRTTLRAAFPHDGRTTAGWLGDPRSAIAALSFWSDAQGASTKGQFATVKRVRRPPARTTTVKGAA